MSLEQCLHASGTFGGDYDGEFKIIQRICARTVTGRDAIVSNPLPGGNAPPELCVWTYRGVIAGGHITHGGGGVAPLT